ncbi:MAG: hypothetical protein P8K77_03575 [Polaribacter sp.]|nr:hypothetical protein [Polaribacter sp.]
MITSTNLKNTLFLLLFFTLGNLFSQKTFFQSVVGDELESSITFMPFGSHTKTIDVFRVWFTAYNYKSFEISVFKNSFSDWTLGLSYKRGWKFTKNFSANYGVGILYGYKGKLKDVRGVPFRDSFLVKGDINPVASFEIDYKISKKLSIHSTLTPLVIIYGLRFYL